MTTIEPSDRARFLKLVEDIESQLKGVNPELAKDQDLLRTKALTVLVSDLVRDNLSEETATLMGSIGAEFDLEGYFAPAMCLIEMERTERRKKTLEKLERLRDLPEISDADKLHQLVTILIEAHS